MAKIKQLYVAEDGTEFNTEVECDAHDEYLRSAGNIEAYIVAKSLHKAQAGLMRTHLAGYLAFRAANPDATAPVPSKGKKEEEKKEEEKKEDAPAGAAA